MWPPANDLTRSQANIVAEAKKEGKVAFFKRGKLTVAPRRPDPRNYAEAADDTRDATADETELEQSADRVRVHYRGQEQREPRSDGVTQLNSPTVHVPHVQTVASPLGLS